MIEFGVCLFLTAAAFFIISMIDVMKTIGAAIVECLDNVGTHRNAQGISVLKHAGFLAADDDEDE